MLREQCQVIDVVIKTETMMLCLDGLDMHVERNRFTNRGKPVDLRGLRTYYDQIKTFKKRLSLKYLYLPKEVSDLSTFTYGICVFMLTANSPTSHRTRVEVN